MSETAMSIRLGQYQWAAAKKCWWKSVCLIMALHCNSCNLQPCVGCGILAYLGWYGEWSDSSSWLIGGCCGSRSSTCNCILKKVVVGLWQLMLFG